MNTRSKIMALALCAFGLMGLSSLSVSAAVVCNNAGDCWHAQRAYTYFDKITLPRWVCGASKR